MGKGNYCFSFLCLRDMQRSICANEFSNFSSSSPPGLLQRPGTQPQALSPPKTGAGRSLGCPGGLKVDLEDLRLLWGPMAKLPKLPAPAEHPAPPLPAQPVPVSSAVAFAPSRGSLLALPAHLLGGGVQAPPWCVQQGLGWEQYAQLSAPQQPEDSHSTRELLARRCFCSAVVTRHGQTPVFLLFISLFLLTKFLGQSLEATEEQSPVLPPAPGEGSPRTPRTHCSQHLHFSP